MLESLANAIIKTSVSGVEMIMLLYVALAFFAWQDIMCRLLDDLTQLW